VLALADELVSRFPIALQGLSIQIDKLAQAQGPFIKFPYIEFLRISDHNPITCSNNKLVDHRSYLDRKLQEPELPLASFTRWTSHGIDTARMASLLKCVSSLKRSRVLVESRKSLDSLIN
jgi:hypothetical protein